MKEFFVKKGIKILALVLAVALIAGLSTHFLKGRAGFATDAAGAVKTPVQKAATAMVGWFENLYGHLYKYDSLVEENESLRAQLAEAQEEARTAAEAIEENQRLRELLGYLEKHSDFDTESAKIVSWGASNWSSTFTISKGSDHGIEVNDCVITEYGALVGQVIELGDTWATVRTIIDVDMNVGALVGGAGAVAVAVGDFQLMHDGQLKVTYMTDSSGIHEKDVVLTSGKGGVFPQGLVIGTVDKVQTEGGGKNPFGIVEPSCDLDTLVQVFIIKDFNIEE